jgi:hypothetical protein
MSLRLPPLKPSPWRPYWATALPALLLAVSFAAASGALFAAAPEEKAGTTADPLAPLAWLEGCWRGSVNQREFREHWMPLRGGMLLGISQTVLGGKTQDFDYLRIESRPDGVFYVIVPSGAKESTFRLTGKTIDADGDRRDEIFTFENPAQEFPQRILYRHTANGGLFAQVEGKVNGADRQVVYPMRRIDCSTGASIQK